MDRAHIAAVIVAPRSNAGAHAKAVDATDPRVMFAGLSSTRWIIDALLGASVRRVGLVGTTAGIDVEELDRTDKAVINVVPSVGVETVEAISWAIDSVAPELSLSDDSNVLLLPADLPHIGSAMLRELIEAHESSGCAATVLRGTEVDAVGTTEPMITFDDVGQVTSILEPLVREDSAPAAVVCVRAGLLIPALRRVTPPGWLRDPLIDDALATIETTGHTVVTLDGPPLERAVSPILSARIEAIIRDRIVEHWLERGVVMADHRLVSIDATVQLAPGVELLPGAVLSGNTSVGDGSIIGPNSHIVNATIGADVHAPCVSVQNIEIPAQSKLRPFSVHGFAD